MLLLRSTTRILSPCTCTPRLRLFSTSTSPLPSLLVQNQQFSRDDHTNVTPTILSKLDRNLHLNPHHPIGILRTLIEQHFHSFTHLNSLSPIVTVEQNFDDLGFPRDHPGRSLTDSYYLNRSYMLRTHTSAHEVEQFRKGEERFLLTADVYRRDEIDRSHYPVFHQMEGCNVVDLTAGKGGLERFERENEEMERMLNQANIVIEDPTRDVTSTNPYQREHDPKVARIISQHLKNSLNGLVLHLFEGLNGDGNDGPLQVRWIEATFPWTAPSYEVEVMYNGKWLEILGCGVVRQDTLARSGVPQKSGWAFGLGLERIAMVLFSIPDIRLFWSQDPRFLNQFSSSSPPQVTSSSSSTTSRGMITTFKPYSKYPECYKDLAFWLPTTISQEGDGNQGGLGGTKKWHENDFMELVRDEAGDLVEGVQLIDQFIHPKTKRESRCYRLNYRSMDRSLSNEEVNKIQSRINERVQEEMKVEVR